MVGPFAKPLLSASICPRTDRGESRYVVGRTTRSARPSRNALVCRKYLPTRLARSGLRRRPPHHLAIRTGVFLFKGKELAPAPWLLAGPGRRLRVLSTPKVRPSLGGVRDAELTGWETASVGRLKALLEGSRFGRQVVDPSRGWRMCWQFGAGGFPGLMAGPDYARSVGPRCLRCHSFGEGGTQPAGRNPVLRGRTTLMAALRGAAASRTGGQMILLARSKDRLQPCHQRSPASGGWQYDPLHRDWGSWWDTRLKGTFRFCR